MSQPFPPSPGSFVPQALLLDERLTPLERNAWLASRSLAGDDGTVVISYASLRGCLPSAPGSPKAALETVARAVLCLRLSTWIALVEACRADDDYLLLLDRASSHASVTMRQLARRVLDAALRHSDALAHLPVAMPERIRLPQQKYHDDGPDDSDGPPASSGTLPIYLPTLDRGRRSEARPGVGCNSTYCRKSCIKKIHAYRPDVRPQSEAPALMLDATARFHRLPSDQQRYLRVRLEALQAEQRQAVLDEWNVRCKMDTCRLARR